MGVLEGRRPAEGDHDRRLHARRRRSTTTFQFVNEPSVIRYTTDGSTPNATSTLWDSTGPREPGEVFHITADHHVQVAGDGHQGQPARRARRSSSSTALRRTGLRSSERPATAGRSPGPVRARWADRGSRIGRSARPSRRRGEGGRARRGRPRRVQRHPERRREGLLDPQLPGGRGRQGRSQAGGRGDRAGRPTRGRLSALELSRRHAHGGQDVRARAGRVAGRPEGLPAAEQRSRVQCRLRARARDRRGAVDRSAGAARGGDGVRGRDTPVTGATAASTGSGMRSCGSTTTG